MYEELAVKILLWVLAILGGPIIFAGSLEKYKGFRRFAVLAIVDFSLLFVAVYIFSAIYWAFWQPIAFFNLAVSPILLVGDWPVDYLFFPIFLFLAWIVDKFIVSKKSLSKATSRSRVGSILFLFLLSWLLGLVAPSIAIFNYRVSKDQFLQPPLVERPIFHKIDATLYGLSNPAFKRGLAPIQPTGELISSVQYNWRKQRWFAFYVTPSFEAKFFFCRSYFDSEGNFFLDESGCARFGR